MCQPARPARSDIKQVSAKPKKLDKAQLSHRRECMVEHTSRASLLIVGPARGRDRRADGELVMVWQVRLARLSPPHSTLQ